MNKACARTTKALLALASCAALCSCSTVEIWEPPAGSARSQQPAAAARPAVIPAVVQPEPVPEPAPAAQAVPVPDFAAGISDFAAELKKLEDEAGLMAPGFVISGTKGSGDDSVTVSLEAKNAKTGSLDKKLELDVPVALLSRIGIETPSGVQTLAMWFASGNTRAVLRKAPVNDAPAVSSLQVRVKGIAFPDGTAGLALDIGNQEKPTPRDFIIALRESDANFITADGGMTLREWIASRAEYRFQESERKVAPLAGGALENWEAFTTVREVGGRGLMTEEHAKSLIPDLKLSLAAEGLAGDGTLSVYGRAVKVRRCVPAGSENDLGLPVCARSVAKLARAAKAAGGRAEPVFIEAVRTNAFPEGIGPVLMKAGNTLLTADQGRIFFWKKTGGVPFGGGRVYEDARIDTTR